MRADPVSTGGSEPTRGGLAAARRPAAPPSSGGGEAGVAIVELALVIVLVVMLLLGFLTGGLAYNQKITLTDAARVAARYGTTHAMPATAPAASACDPTPTTGEDQWLVDVACDAIANAQGELDPGTSGRSICVAFAPLDSNPNDDPPTLSGASMLQWGESNSGSVVAGTCPGGVLTGSSTNDQVEVVVQRTANFSIALWSKTLTLQSQAYGRYEQTPAS